MEIRSFNTHICALPRSADFELPVALVRFVWQFLAIDLVESRRIRFNSSKCKIACLRRNT